MESENTINITGFISNFAESVDGIDASALEPSTLLSDLEAWDSLAVLITITMADSEYNVDLDGKKVVDCETIQDIVDLIRSKQGK